MNSDGQHILLCAAAEFYRLAETLASCTAMSKKRMEKAFREITETKLAGDSSPLPFSSNAEISRYLFDFLFATQDASTSSVLWVAVLFTSHPAVLARVSEGVSGIWSSKLEELITEEQPREMRCTQVVTAVPQRRGDVGVGQREWRCRRQVRDLS